MSQLFRYSIAPDESVKTILSLTSGGRDRSTGVGCLVDRFAVWRWRFIFFMRRLALIESRRVCSEWDANDWLDCVDFDGSL